MYFKENEGEWKEWIAWFVFRVRLNTFFILKSFQVSVSAFLSKSWPLFCVCSFYWPGEGLLFKREAASEGFLEAKLLPLFTMFYYFAALWKRPKKVGRAASSSLWISCQSSCKDIIELEQAVEMLNHGTWLARFLFPGVIFVVTALLKILLLLLQHQTCH